MSLRAALIICSNFFFLSALAQSPEERLNRWSAISPIEKVYLHFDRDNYAAGETAWFKAYMASDGMPDTISTTLYVEFLNEKSDIINKQALPVVAGVANGQIEIPDSLLTSTYAVRSYSATMLNHDKSFVPIQLLKVYGKVNKAPANSVSKINIGFFPEGGNFVAGHTNTIAFKATYENGWPVNVSGSIKNSKGETVSSFATYHDGMGMFELSPSANEKYVAEVNGNKYELPAVSSSGIVLTLIPHPQGSYFEIKQAKDNPDFTAAYMIGQMQHRVVFKQQLKSGATEQQGVINTERLRSGVLQVTVFNKDHMPLAERLYFVNNKEYLQPLSINVDTLDLSARGKNRLTIALQDTVQGNLSISVTDADYDDGNKTEHIISSLLFTSDIKGYVHNPAWYFSADNDTVKTAMDLVMMTNGWRRFKWTELIKQQPPALYKDNAFITLSGKVNMQGGGRPFGDKDILLMTMSANKKRTTNMLRTDDKGKFFIDSLIYFDRTRLLFSDIKGKKSKYIDVELNGDSLQTGFKLPSFAFLPQPLQHDAGLSAKWKMNYEEIMKANGQMLEEVKIKVQKKSPIQQLDERYTTGMFSGDATKAIDLVNTDEASPYNNVFDYLQSRVNGLQIINDGVDYGIFYRQGPTVSSMGNIPMTIFLDEIETDQSVIATIPANQVALIKIYNTFAGGWGNSPGGVLSIYTKKGADYVSSTSFSNLKIYQGYSVIKEFYAPDYKKENDKSRVDNRITLDWRPNIFLNHVNPKVPLTFYNNDRTKKFKVIVEGMTVNGKFIFLEKEITKAPKAFEKKRPFIQNRMKGLGFSTIAW
jgi:hypothetical protein